MALPLTVFEVGVVVEAVLAPLRGAVDGTGAAVVVARCPDGEVGAAVGLVAFGPPTQAGAGNESECTISSTVLSPAELTRWASRPKARWGPTAMAISASTFRGPGALKVESRVVTPQASTSDTPVRAVPAPWAVSGRDETLGDTVTTTLSGVEGAWKVTPRPGVPASDHPAGYSTSKDADA